MEVGVNLGVLGLSTQRGLWKGGWSRDWMQAWGVPGALHTGHMLAKQLKLKCVWASVVRRPSMTRVLAGQLKLNWVQVRVFWGAQCRGVPGWATRAEAGAGRGVLGTLRRGALVE